MANNYSQRIIQPKLVKLTKNCLKVLLNEIKDNASINKGIIIHLLQEALKPGGWQAFYPKLVQLGAKLSVNSNQGYHVITCLKILHDLYHNNHRKNNGRNAGIYAHQKWFKDTNDRSINFTPQDKTKLQQDLTRYIDIYINKLKENEEPQVIQQQIDTYKQQTANIEVNDNWQNLPDDGNYFGFTDEQKNWLNRNNKIHNFLHHGDNAKFKPIKDAITAGFLNQGTVNHILAQIIAKPVNIDYEKFYGEHLNKLYSHLLENRMNDDDARKVIIAFKHIFDVYHNENCQSNNEIQTAWQRHFPGLNIADKEAKEFKEQINTLLKNEIDNSEQAKKQQENYAKDCKNITPNPRWQYYEPEYARFTREQNRKLSAQTELSTEYLPINSLHLLAIAIVNKYNKLTGHSPVNPAYNKLTIQNQIKVNSLLPFLKYIPLKHNNQLNLEVLNQTIKHASNIDTNHFNLETFRKIQFDTDKDSKDLETVKKTLIPHKVQQNIYKLIADFIDQIQIRDVQEVPYIKSMLQAFTEPNAGHVINTSETNNISSVYTKIHGFMRNLKPDNLTREEFNAACTGAILNYINKHLNNPDQYQLFFNNQQKRQEEVKRNRTAKNYLKQAQNLANQASNELTGEGFFTPEQYEQNLKNLIQEGKIVSYTSHTRQLSKAENTTEKITEHTYQMVLPHFDDSNNPIVMKSSVTTDEYGTTHIKATIPNLDIDSERATFLILSYLRTLKNTGLEKVNIGKLDQELQARFAACCKLLKLETDIEPKNMRLYKKFYDELNNKSTQQQWPQPKNTNQPKMPQNMQEQFQNMMQQQEPKRKSTINPPSNPY